MSAQTLLNHYGGKEALFAAVIEQVSGELQVRREEATPGDPAGAVAVLVGDYELTGDATIRLLALEDRLPAVREVTDLGRRGHREWVGRVFGAPDRVAELLVVTDVQAWRLLRRNEGLSRRATAAAMTRMVEAVLARP